MLNKLLEVLKQNLEGEATGKEQLQKEKKKNPIGVKALSFAQYAVEHGFNSLKLIKWKRLWINLQEATI